MKKMNLLETYNLLLESAASEIQALKILKTAGIVNPEEIIKKFANGVGEGEDKIEGDKSANQKHIPFMAVVYANGFTNIDAILKDFNSFNELLLNNRVKPMQIVNNKKVIDGIKYDDYKIVIDGTTFDDYNKLSEFIHGKSTLHSDKPKNTSSEKLSSKVKKFWSNKKFDIYDGNSVEKCIQYTQGGLTGQNYPFCIGQFGNTMYQSYRNTNTSTFYYIIDKTRIKKSSGGGLNLDDPLHIVVFDVGANSVTLTDANNTTGTIALPFDKNVDNYITYLIENGVEVDKMINRPKTDAEIAEDKLLGKSNSDLDWFKRLSFEHKKSYIGRGHPLTNDQFIYLTGNE